MRGIALVLVGWAGCSGKDDETTPAEGDCADFVGTVFSLDAGQGTARGTLSIPAEVPDGMQLEVMLGQNGAWYGLLPENLFETPVTCGGPVDFEVQQLEPGTYELVGRVLGEGTDEILAEGYLDGTFDSADDVVEGLDVTLTAL